MEFPVTNDILNTILCVGINHRSAPVQVRERYALSEDDTLLLYKTLIQRDSINELFSLSTCNRVEVYGVSDQSREFARSVSAVFEELGKPGADSSKPPFFLIQGERAVLHLLRVTAGMDSMMLGETQIAAQVKDAFSQAKKNGATGQILNRLIQTSLEAGKRVRAETSLSGGAMSVSYAAVEHASSVFSDLSKTAVLIVGAGNVGRLTGSYFRKKGVTRFLVSNRRKDRGIGLAGELGGTSVSLGDMTSALSEVQIVVTCTAAQRPQLTKESLEKRSKKGSGDLLILDLSVPRNVEPGAEDLPGVSVVTVDSLEGVVAGNIARREKELPRAERVISEVKDKFIGWLSSLVVAPTIRELTEALRGIKREEIKRVRNVYSEDVAAAVDRVSERMIRNLLKGPISALKASAESGDDAAGLVDTVRSLYKLRGSTDNG